MCCRSLVHAGLKENQSSKEICFQFLDSTQHYITLKEFIDAAIYMRIQSIIHEINCNGKYVV